MGKVIIRAALFTDEFVQSHRKRAERKTGRKKPRLLRKLETSCTQSEESQSHAMEWLQDKLLDWFYENKPDLDFDFLSISYSYVTLQHFKNEAIGSLAHAPAIPQPQEDT